MPLVFNMHFMGTMDHWDPAVTDGFAKDREVILFDNAGVSSSSGEVPETFAQMGANAVAFVKALGLEQVDVLGFSIGGLVAQEITLQAPDLVRRLVLSAPDPRSGESMDTGRQKAMRYSARLIQTRTICGCACISRRRSKAISRTRIRQALSTAQREPRSRSECQQAALAQRAAIGKWGAKRDRAWDYLKDIKQPVLVVNGGNDVIIYTINSYILQQNLPNAELIIDPNSAHGSLFQYPQMFVRHVVMFLDQAA